MSISLPMMNNLCQRWRLPPFFQEKCDFYFLRNYGDWELPELLQQEDETEELYIRVFGIPYKVVWMYEAEDTFQKAGGLEPRTELTSLNYWCSFRSITFEFEGKSCTKSYVLIQVDRKEKQEKQGSDGAKPLSGLTSETRNLLKPLRHAQNCESGTAKFKSFAELSQPKEKD